MRPGTRLGRSALATLLLVALTIGTAASARQLPGAPTFPTPAQPNAASQTTGKGLVLGLVADAKTGRGVANAVVKLALRGAYITRLTDSKGRFYFKDLPAATLGITATKPGFFDGAYGKKRPNGTGMPLVLYENQWITDLKIDLWRPAMLSGTVVDENNEPVVGVEVRVERRQLFAGRVHLIAGATRQTNDEGRYRFADLMPGEYVVFVPTTIASVPVEQLAASGTLGTTLLSGTRLNDRNIAADAAGTHLVMARGWPSPPPKRGETWVYPTMYYPGVPDVSASQSLTLESGESRSAIDVQLRPVPALSVSGRVIGMQKSSVAIRIVRSGAEDLGLGAEAAATMSAADGTFVLPMVPVGDYVLEARQLSALEARVVMSPDPEVSSTLNMNMTIALAGLGSGSSITGPVKGETLVSLIDRDVTGVEIVMAPSVSIDGLLMFKGAGKLPAEDQRSRVPIVVEAADGSVTRVAGPGHVRSDGQFTISGVLPGRYFVRAGSAPLGWFFESAMLNGRDVSDVPLDADSDVDDLVITFTNQPTTLTGTVRDARGGPVSSATVILFPVDRGYLTEYGANPRRLRNIRVPATGVFSVTGLPAGDYLLVAIDEADADNWQDPARLEAWRTTATRITLASAETKVQDLRMFVKKQP